VEKNIGVKCSKITQFARIKSLKATACGKYQAKISLIVHTFKNMFVTSVLINGK